MVAGWEIRILDILDIIILRINLQFMKDTNLWLCIGPTLGDAEVIDSEIQFSVRGIQSCLSNNLIWIFQFPLVPLTFCHLL